MAAVTLEPATPEPPTPASQAAARRTTVRSALRWWPAVLLAIWLLLVIVPQVLARQNPDTLDPANALASPSAQHWFGTDEAGRDVFARCVYGIRYSVGVSIAIVLIAALVGSVLGGLAGLGNKLLDGLVMRTTDVFLAFPYLILAIAIAAAEGPGLTTALIALAAVWWPSYARLVRGQVLVLRELPFVEGARAVNTPLRRIFVRHMLPHLGTQLYARIAMDIGYAILALTGLSFLGLGVQPPTPELGSIIADARNYTLQAWWYATLPGLFILAAVVSSICIANWLERYAEGTGR
jgi:peptide/nickel transport system permease protein